MHMKRVLISADDVHTRARFRSAVESLDVTLAECATADLAATLVAEVFDLVVADGAMEPEPLAEVVERALAEGSEVRLLLVIEPSALPSLRMPARLTADFMVRGASSEELVARVRALLWPGQEVGSQEVLRVDDLTVNLATYQAYRDGAPIDFTYLEYALFAFLVTHPNRAYSREVLLSRVWGTDYFGGARTVDVHVRRVRAKLGAELGRRLETVRNVGYLWSA